MHLNTTSLLCDRSLAAVQTARSLAAQERVHDPARAHCTTLLLRNAALTPQPHAACSRSHTHIKFLLLQVPEGESHSTLVRMCRVSTAQGDPVTFCVLRRNRNNTISGAVALTETAAARYSRCSLPAPKTKILDFSSFTVLRAATVTVSSDLVEVAATRADYLCSTAPSILDLLIVYAFSVSRRCWKNPAVRMPQQGGLGGGAGGRADAGTLPTYKNTAFETPSIRATAFGRRSKADWEAALADVQMSDAARAAAAEQLEAAPWSAGGARVRCSSLAGPREVLIGDAAHAVSSRCGHRQFQMHCRSVVRQNTGSVCSRGWCQQRYAGRGAATP